MKKHLLFAFFSLILVTGCSSTPVTQQEKIGTVEQLYNDAMDLLQGKSYREAIHTFEELQRQYPYSGWSTRSEMMVIFAYYQMLDYPSVITGVDTFIRNHPSHQDVAYALYLKGVSYYEQIKDVKRDQKSTLQALQALEELVSRFPSSDYARDAKLKISLCKDHLAGKEMMIGRYYLEQARYLAAINRFRYVIESYQTTSQTPEALYRLTEAYLSLGIEDEATASASVLGHNFPNSHWYQDAYDLLTKRKIKMTDYIAEDSWFSDVWQGVKDTVAGSE